MAKGNFIVRGKLLEAVDEDTEALLSKYQGRELCLSVSGSRNPKFHRLAMKCFTLIADQLDIQQDALREWCKEKLFEYDIAEFPDGTKRKIYRSHSYESMDEGRFKQHMDRCVYLMFTHLLPGEQWHDLRDEVCRIYDGHWYSEPMAAA